jgi:hypothetical protein
MKKSILILLTFLVLGMTLAIGEASAYYYMDYSYRPYYGYSYYSNYYPYSYYRYYPYNKFYYAPSPSHDALMMHAIDSSYSNKPSSVENFFFSN